jgi:phosphoribosylformimino-5-aminoimidazole carboxamide ribotide isomerase
VRIVGVIDLAGGQAVHARAGAREKYQPVQRAGGMQIEPGDALAVAEGYLRSPVVTDLYIADLDAIRESARAAAAPATENSRVVSGLARLDVPLWLDSGVSTVDDGRHVLDLGVARVVVGLETLRSYEALEAICCSLDSGRTAFSLDLRAGEPMLLAQGTIVRERPVTIAARAADAGAGALIVIDVARVGTAAGPDLHLIAAVRKAAPDVMLLAGGGVRHATDLARLADAGCDAALVATALLEGRLR